MTSASGILAGELFVNRNIPTPKRILLVYVLVGFFLPWAALAVAAVYYRRFDELAAFPVHLFGGGYNYFLVACLNAIPFLVIAALTVIHHRTRAADVAGRSGLTAAACVVLLTTAFYQGAAWFNIAGPHPDALTGIAFVVVPFVAACAGAVAGVVTWIVVAAWRRVKRESATT